MHQIARTTFIFYPKESNERNDCMAQRHAIRNEHYFALVMHNSPNSRIHGQKFSLLHIYWLKYSFEDTCSMLCWGTNLVLSHECYSNSN